MKSTSHVKVFRHKIPGFLFDARNYRDTFFNDLKQSKLAKKILTITLRRVNNPQIAEELLEIACTAKEDQFER